MKLKALISLDLKQQHLPENLLIQSVDDALLLFIQQKHCEETKQWSSQDKQLFEFYDRWTDILLEARMTMKLCQYGGQSLMNVCFHIDVGNMYQEMSKEDCWQSVKSQIVDFMAGEHLKVADQWRERQKLTQDSDAQLKVVIDFHQAWADILGSSSFDLEAAEEQDMVLEYGSDGDIGFRCVAA